MKSVFIIFSMLLFLMACCPQKTELSKTTNEDSMSINEHLVMAVLYQQQAAERVALSYQAYNIARIMLDENLKAHSSKKKKAIVVDIDETVLDNSPFEAKSIVEGTQYPAYWKEWINNANAKPVPGSVDFLNYASSKNVETFYITNRKVEFKNATIKNLQDAGFPYADTLHVFFKSDKSSSKEPSRQKVSTMYSIILLIGDNLADFSFLYDHASSQRRIQVTDSLKNEFGKKFIVLPNAMYGDWEDALYNYNYKYSIRERDSIRKMNLKAF